jgi:DNA invertase Pin-like site-specific DNA recombinase
LRSAICACWVIIAVDNPHANKLTVHILAAVAQHEREMISQRTKDALQAAKFGSRRPRISALVTDHAMEAWYNPSIA